MIWRWSVGPLGVEKASAKDLVVVSVQLPVLNVSSMETSPTHENLHGTCMTRNNINRVNVVNPTQKLWTLRSTGRSWHKLHNLAYRVANNDAITKTTTINRVRQVLCTNTRDVTKIVLLILFEVLKVAVVDCKMTTQKWSIHWNTSGNRDCRYHTWVP